MSLFICTIDVFQRKIAEEVTVLLFEPPFSILLLKSTTKVTVDISTVVVVVLSTASVIEPLELPPILLGSKLKLCCCYLNITTIGYRTTFIYFNTVFFLNLFFVCESHLIAISSISDNDQSLKL